MQASLTKAPLLGQYPSSLNSSSMSSAMAMGIDTVTYFLFYLVDNPSWLFSPVLPGWGSGFMAGDDVLVLHMVTRGFLSYVDLIKIIGLYTDFLVEQFGFTP